MARLERGADDGSGGHHDSGRGVKGRDHGVGHGGREAQGEETLSGMTVDVEA